MNTEENEQEVRYPCPECYAGHMSLQHVAYYTWLHGELISVPDFPAWVCDMCGTCEYDQRALSWLSIILNPDAGHKPRPRQVPLAPPKRPPIQPEV